MEEQLNCSLCGKETSESLHLLDCLHPCCYSCLKPNRIHICLECNKKTITSPKFDLKSSKFKGLVEGKGYLQTLFNNPGGICFDLNGNLLICDQSSHQLRIVRSDNFKWIYSIGKGPSSLNGMLNSPHGVCITPNGDVCIADTGNARLSLFSSNGQFKMNINLDVTSPYGFSPIDVAYDQVHNRFVVADLPNHLIRMFDLNGKQIGLFGGYGWIDNLLSFPSNICVNSNGEFLVADRQLSIRLFDSEGNFLKKFADIKLNQKEDPHVRCSMSIDLYDRVIASNYSREDFSIFDSDGSLMSTINLNNETESNRHYPRCLSFGTNGLIACSTAPIVFGQSCHRIQFYSSNL